MRRVVVGTAGHIDHGKTSLLEALTGVDCDRWAEEKERGITIDLGFTHLEEPGLQVGFVDVPGHERFLHNALAGLGGIRLMLLVVAADEGVNVQTREHLDICTLLEIPHGMVALTKVDLVDDEMAELAHLEVEELLESTPYAGAPILPVSSVTGQGVDDLRRALVARAREVALDEVDPSSPVRLPVDRAFQLKGLGAVVTGTLVSGRIEVGQSLALLPRTGDDVVRVRSVQVHGQDRPRAEAGERTALQLTGVELASLERGEQLVTPGVFSPSRRMVGRLRVLDEAPAPLKGWTPVRLHLLTHEVLGTMRALSTEDAESGQGVIEPGAEGWVEFHLKEPVVAVRDDRFIVRRPSPPFTLGGGRILDPHWQRRRGRRIARALGKLEDLDDAVILWVAETGARGLAPDELAPRFGVRARDAAATLDRLSSAGRLLRVDAGSDGRWLHPRVCQDLVTRTKDLLADYFAQHRLAKGMPRAEFLERLLPRGARDLDKVHLRMLQGAGVARLDGDLVNPPGRRADDHLTGEESALATDLLAAVEAGGLTAPSPAELARRLGAKAQIVEGVQRYLVQQGKLVRLPSGLILSNQAVDQLAEDLRASGWQRFSVPEFKERYELSRKWAIPLLEHLDSLGVTRRLGDERMVVGA